MRKYNALKGYPCSDLNKKMFLFRTVISKCFLSGWLCIKPIHYPPNVSWCSSAELKMKSVCIFSLIIILCCLSIKAQRLNCSRIRENCRPCTRRLVDPINNLEFINRDCREKVRERWIWRDVRRCEMQIFACESKIPLIKKFKK